MEPKKSYVKTSVPAINHLLRFKIFIILSNWIFQGMLYADKTERRFKLFLDFLMALILYAIIYGFYFNIYVDFIIVFFIAHTINWIFNGQLFVLGRYIGIEPNKQGEFSDYIQKLGYRAKTESSIQLIAVYGSMSRKNIHSSSDLDVRILRKKGFLNGIKACFFGLLERIRALYNRFPLDLYVIDDKNHLLKMRTDEEPIIIYDSSRRRKAW